MKRLFHIVLALVALITAAGCEGWFNTEEPEMNMVLVYIAATEQSVSNYASGNIADLLSGYVPAKSSKKEALLVFVQKKDVSTASGRSDATLTRYYANNSGEVISELIYNYGSEFNACDPSNFERVLADAQAECNPTRRTLAFSSHGTGWMPEGYFDGRGDFSRTRGLCYSMSREDEGMQLSKLAKVESIGYDGPTKEEMDIRDFAEIVGKYKWDALLLDCCYMGAIEAAYQLKDCSDWIIASPTEILIYGFPYDAILEKAYKEPIQSGYEYICQKYYDFYEEKGSQGKSYQSGTIALVNCKELDALADVCAAIVDDRRPEIGLVARMSVQRYFYKASKDYFFDLSDYFKQFATETQYSLFETQLKNAVPFCAATDEFIGLKIDKEHFCGVSCYIPNPDYPNLNAYYKQLAWNQKIQLVK